jgi:nitrate reductase beta subunit
MLSGEDYGVIAVAERAKRLGITRKHMKKIIEKAEKLIEENGLTEEQVEKIYRKYMGG